MGLFSNMYTKEGKGVEKNAPQKNSFFTFFEYYGRHFSKLITGNMLFTIVSFPIVTLGLAQAGLTYICRSAARDQHCFPSDDFFDTIKKNWKQALASGIIDIIVFAILGFDIFYAYSAMADNMTFMNQAYFGLSVVLALIYWFSTFYRPFMIITFKMKLSKIFKNSFIFAMSSLGTNLVIALAHAILLILGFFIVYMLGYIGGVIVLMVYFLLYPAFSIYLQQFSIFPIIKKIMIDPYYEQHPDDDILLRRRLGLLPPEEDDFDYDSLTEEESTNE